jgi:hypothetical protein
VVYGAPGYEVSSHGRVRTVDRTVQRDRCAYRLKSKILGGSRNQIGHKKVRLRLPTGNWTMRYVHALVLESFVGARPKGKEAAHRDGIAANNHWRNLRWATPKQNAKDKIAHGTNLGREGHPGSRLNEVAVKDIRARLKRGETQYAVADIYGVARTTIQAIANGRSWRVRRVRRGDA